MNLMTANGSTAKSQDITKKVAANKNMRSLICLDQSDLPKKGGKCMFIKWRETLVSFGIIELNNNHI